MSVLNLTLATKGMNLSTRLKILSRHAYAFVRHSTPRKLMNFVNAEMNRVAKKVNILSYPYILKIESTNICNLRCAYCYEGRRPPKKGERVYGHMSFADFRRIVDEVGHYLFKINLYGFGEPFLFPETIEMIRYAADRNIGVGVSSNMNFTDVEMPRRIVDSGLEVLIFSCHGVSQESYAKFMVNGDAALAYRNMEAVLREKRRLKSRTPIVDWQFCVTRFNQAEIDMAVQRANEMGIDQIRFIKPFFPDDASDEWFSDRFPRNAELQALETEGGGRGCSWPYRSAYINYDGGLIPCCKDTRYLASDFGNVLRDGFMNVWNNEMYQACRKLLANPDHPHLRLETLICSKCPAAAPRALNA